MRIRVFILLSIIGACDCGFTCLNCDSVALPRLCTQIDKCGPHEVCSLEQYITPIGSIRYKQKCIDKQACASRKREILSQKRLGRSVDSTICMKCCSGDLCNSGGCLQKGFDDDSTEHVCYNCGTQIGNYMCDRIQQCGRDQLCQITPLDIPGAPKNLFKSQCQSVHACAAEPAIIGRKRSTCHTCCNGSLCNDYDPTGSCDGHHVIPSTTSTVTPSYASGSRTQYTTSTVTTPPISRTDRTPHTTSTTRATTQQSHAGGFGECKDVMAVCPKSYCTLDAYKEWSKDNCKKTCGYCAGGATTIGPQLACNDIASGCSTQLCSLSDYHTWTKQQCEKTCGYCTVHASANEGNGWFLLLKAVAGVTSPSTDIYPLWARNITLNSKIPAYADYTATFKGQFKPDFANHWDLMRFDKVTVSMYINGTERAFITFNTTGLDKVSWFKADRVIDSTWGQQPRQGHFHMDVSSTTGLEFSAESTPGGAATGCDVTGWMTVATNANCVDNRLPFAAFLFCPGNQTCRWNQGHYVSAEVLAIHGHATGKCRNTV